MCSIANYKQNLKNKPIESNHKYFLKKIGSFVNIKRTFLLKNSSPFFLHENCSKFAFTLEESTHFQLHFHLPYEIRSFQFDSK